MKNKRWGNLLFLIFVLAASAMYLSGVPVVPFHPDESTQIFMSEEIAMLRLDPDHFFWSPGQDRDLRQHYRVIDAPVVRYAIEAIRTTAGLPPQPVDWDWSKSWEENRNNNALPDWQTLQTVRFGLALLFPLDLLLIFDIGRRLHGHLTGWISAGLLATNALVLIHTRRAMAEGILLFALLLATWTMLAWQKRAWLAAAPVALAFSTKHSAVAMLVPGLLAAFWSYPRKPEAAWRSISIAGFLALFAAVVLLLNPFMWSDPLQAALDVWKERSDLTAAMTGMFSQVSPNLIMDTVPERVFALGAQLFFTQPAVMDVANYSVELQNASQSYLSNPLHSLLRGAIGGGLMLGLTLFGMVLAVRTVIRKGIRRCRERSLLLIITFAWLVLLSISVPIPFQRYYLPMVPFASLWSAYGLADIGRAIYRAR